MSSVRDSMYPFLLPGPSFVTMDMHSLQGSSNALSSQPLICFSSALCLHSPEPSWRERLHQYQFLTTSGSGVVTIHHRATKNVSFSVTNVMLPSWMVQWWFRFPTKTSILDLEAREWHQDELLPLLCGDTLRVGWFSNTSCSWETLSCSN